MLAGRQGIRGRQRNEAGESRRGSPAKPAAAASPAWTYLAPVHLERPGAPVQHKGCTGCSSDEPCASCGGGGLVASSGTQHRRHTPSHDPAELQADEIGARIAAELGGVGELSSGELPHGVRTVAERHLGTGLHGTRLVGGGAGHERATRERAYALTEGSTIHFLGGQLTTRTPHGRFLLGHELTHVAQQRAARRPHAPQKLSWDDVTGAVGDVASGIAGGVGEVASGVASGVGDVAHGVASGVSDVAHGVASGVGDVAHGVASGVSDVAGGVATGAGDVAHGIATGDPLGGLARGASSVAGGVAAGASDVAGGVAAGARDVAGGVAAGTRDVAGGVAAGASDVLGGLRRGAASVGGGLVSGAGRILGGLGLGISPAPGGGFLITIPDVDLCEPHDMPIIDSPEWSMFVPLYGGAVPVGPVMIGGALGFTVRYRMQLMMALGPCVLRHIAVLIDPLGGRYGGTAQLYMAAALGPRFTLSGALAAMGGIVIPTVPPITLIAGVEGGLRGTGRASALGAIQSTVAVLYSGGRLSFSATNDLMAALHLRGDLDAYVAATVFNRIVCEYVWNLLSWEGGPAWRLRIPITAGIGGGAPAGGRIGPISWGMIPISSIANAIQGTVPGKHCMTWREILRMLCEITAVPESICKVLLPDKDDSGGDGDGGDPSSVGPMKDVKASGRCKCVGDDACGGGRIYEFTFSTKKGCKNAQKDADDCCNNNETMKQRCVRPRCYYRHTDPTCPDENNDAPPCPGRLLGSGGPSGGPSGDDPSGGPYPSPAPAPGVNPPIPPPPPMPLPQPVKRLNFFHGTRWSVAKKIPGNVKAIGGGDFAAGFYTHHDANDAKAKYRALQWACRVARDAKEKYGGVIRFNVDGAKLSGMNARNFNLTSLDQADYAQRQAEWIKFITTYGRNPDPEFQARRRGGVWLHQRREPPQALSYDVVTGPFYKPLPGDENRKPADSEFEPFSERRDLPQQVVFANKGADLLNDPDTKVELTQHQCEPLTGNVVDPPDDTAAAAAGAPSGQEVPMIE